MDEIILETIENNHKITEKSDPKFLHEFQKAVLLVLLEDGTLTEPQYRSAEEDLRKQSLYSQKSGCCEMICEE